MNLTEYQHRAVTTALPASMNPTYMTLGLAGEAGEIANKIKKLCIRDKGTMTTEDELKMRLALRKEIGDTLWYVAGFCSVMGFDLDQIAQENLEKLAKRKEEGKITGSGDNR